MKHLIPLYFGWIDESWRIKIPLLENVTVGNQAITYVLLQISHPALQLASATLKIDAQFTGLRLGQLIAYELIFSYLI